MESFRKITALILFSISFCSAHSLGVGGSVCYTSLLGEFGRDSNGGVSLSLVCGIDLSPTENLSILTGFSRLKGRENEGLCVSMKSLSARFLLFPMAEKPYFLKYSMGLIDFERCVNDHVEHAKYPAVGFGGGVSIPVSKDTELSLAVGFSRILERFRSGDIISFDAEFIHHP